MTDGCALHAAALGGNMDLLRILLTRDLNVNARAKKGQTPFACTLARGRESTASFLYGKGGRVGVDL